ncbi:MAG TPA: NAD(P)H-quinone oxidoreductase [Gemmatimonadaceae bacterium]|jgi:NADPH2:quinone reductase|nr:NAD(P)H-quinone oxidoreductase [Gemmatimonadaceae bacterium]
MRAAVITRPGGPEVLEVEQRPTPIPRASEVLVRVRASALNRADLAQRQGHYPAPPGFPADIPGLEFAGEIEAVGEDAHGWREGDRVFGITGGGGNAEYLVADAGTVARVPETLSWTEAASVPEAFMTAYDSLVTQAQIQRGETVLIHAVGSGVGLAGTQLARAWSATPYGTARTADKIERAHEYGLHDGAVLADDPEAFVPHVERWTDGKGIDVTLDLVGGAYVPADVRAAATRGRIMIVGTVAGATATVPIGMVLRKRLTLRGTALRSRSLDEKRAVTRAFARDVVPLFETAALRPVIDQVFDLEQIGAAHERLASNATFGKIVLRVH